jgi:hypothetical protein
MATIPSVTRRVPRREILCVVGAWLGVTPAVATPAPAAIHAPEIETRLDWLVGDWTLAGHEATCRETCEWYGDRAFVVCSSSDSSDGSHSRSILGYSQADGHFTYHNYGHDGRSRSEFGFPAGERGLTFIDQRRTASGWVRSTTTLTPTPDGRIHFRRERSVNGGPWQTTNDFHYLPRQSVTRSP